MRVVSRNISVPALKSLGLIALAFSLAAAPKPESAAAKPAKAPANRLAARKASPELLRPATAVPVKLTAIANRPASIEQHRTVRMEVTAYCPCTRCCGPAAQGITANGQRISYNGGKFVAADTDFLPFGTRLQIPGYDSAPVEVIDRGGAIKGRKLDVFFPTHDQALEWGRRTIDVTVID